MDRESAINVICASPLASDADRLIADLLPSLGIEARRATCELAPGASRFGGSPDLPKGFQWPRGFGSTIVEWDAKLQRGIRTASKEVFLNFVAQIRLEELPAFGDRALLPTTGSLCFFYDFEHQPWGFDPADGKGWKVVYFDVPASQLARTHHPQGDSQFASQLCQLSYKLEWTLPDYGESMEGTKPDPDWCDEAKELLVDINDWDGFNAGLHRLLGHAQHIQGDMQLECQLASNGIYCGNPSAFQDPCAQELIAGAKDWCLLLQVDTDEDGPGWMWGDCGRIYYWIRETDLRQRAFDAAWFALQCY
jgi:uncharacterized protein YwqG